MIRASDINEVAAYLRENGAEIVGEPVNKRTGIPDRGYYNPRLGHPIVLGRVTQSIPDCILI